MPIAQQTIYHDYAPIYDAIGQETFAATLTAQLLPKLPTLPRSALDLATGTGGAARTLAAAGLLVTAVDRSARMLEIARGRARDQGLTITWIEADLLDLPIATPLLSPASFELITCLYDSLNYLTGDDGLARLCAAVARLLAPGGQFIFDLNTEAEYSNWDDRDQVVYDTGGMLVYNRLRYDRTRRIAQGRITWFSHDGTRWWRGSEQHTQRAWSEPELLSALEGTGLQLTDSYTPRWSAVSPDSPRIVYVVTR
jgi:SAM-dependent methyltransferase